MRRFAAHFLAALVILASGACPTAASSWQRRTPPTRIDESPFHATEAIVLPTAETVGSRTLLFEISHRFVPRISDGSDVLWGLDGPAYIRFSLGYGIGEQFMATIGRSNRLDSYDLTLKYLLDRSRFGSISTALALRGGAVWYTEVAGREAGNNRNYQYYAQAILNASAGRRLSLGIVASYLYNFAILSEDIEHALTVGWYGAVRLSSVLALTGEWNIAEKGYYYERDPVSLGIQLETGGHFFKIFVSNSTQLNPAGYLPGTNASFEPRNWHLGFIITRLLRM